MVGCTLGLALRDGARAGVVPAVLASGNAGFPFGTVSMSDGRGLGVAVGARAGAGGMGLMAAAGMELGGAGFGAGANVVAFGGGGGAGGGNRSEVGGVLPAVRVSMTLDVDGGRIGDFMDGVADGLFVAGGGAEAGLLALVEDLCFDELWTSQTRPSAMAGSCRAMAVGAAAAALCQLRSSCATKAAIAKAGTASDDATNIGKTFHLD